MVGVGGLDGIQTLNLISLSTDLSNKNIDKLKVKKIVQTMHVFENHVQDKLCNVRVGL